MSAGKACIQSPAPQFTATAVVDGDFQQVSLSDYKGKYVVLFFYPLDFTFVCPTEIIAFSDRVKEFRDIGCEVLACSTDSEFSHHAWTNIPRKKGGLGCMNIPLIADKNCQISRDYGVLKEDDGIAYRGLFIVDNKGILRQITINDLPVGRSVDETLRLVKAFQFTDEHGEVCPAGWKPGEPTIKPGLKDSQDYFSKQWLFWYFIMFCSMDTFDHIFSSFCGKVEGNWPETLLCKHKFVVIFIKFVMLWCRSAWWSISNHDFLFDKNLNEISSVHV